MTAVPSAVLQELLGDPVKLAVHILAARVRHSVQLEISRVLVASYV
jgi:hypothetical protein